MSILLQNMTDDIIPIRPSILMYDTKRDLKFSIEVPTPEDIDKMKRAIKPIIISEKKSDQQEELEELMRENEALDKEIKTETLNLYKKELQFCKSLKENKAAQIQGAYDHFQKRCQNGQTLFKILDTDVNYIINYIKTSKPEEILSIQECDTNQIAKLLIDGNGEDAIKLLKKTMNTLASDIKRIYVKPRA